ncbi:mitochondrial glycoprotein [Microdochium trichocladiopsis]|uniref:Mitochondrial glycoprotein n=1 Tax=Microdochium trichocladiopsis TaxID=1682393 RepID=A0A9P8Y6N7_9PEZI|nr:mitochondrial glycoprotein [Microdochium trichocladiopsis]KAH7029062.1 mitochondrial glycoprotein [Microdochium trichocladiopsis]
MMSLRTLARSAPRATARLSLSALRLPAAASRTASLLRSSAAAAAPLRTAQNTAAAFSTTPLRWAPAGEVDEELSAKLESELQFEGELKEAEQTPASVKDFLDNSPFKLQDTPGKEDVILTRQFGNETITVTFSISDLSNFEPDMYNEDSALGDEDLPPHEREAIEAEEGAEGEGEEGETPIPCRLNVVVEKGAGKGCLNIEAIAQDGQIMVENFYYFKDPKIAHSADADAAHAAQDVYPGPPFGSLDQDLQDLMERYLEERGVNQALALFVPDYMDVKEQREYQAWLKDVKSFVDE